jgi:hypothetical protein
MPTAGEYEACVWLRVVQCPATIAALRSELSAIEFVISVSPELSEFILFVDEH